MLREEAEWFGEKFQSIGPGISPMLNIGCSTLAYRTVEQPWIDEHIFRPMRESGQHILHMDIKKDEGVDIVGDITDRKIIDDLSSMGVNSIFCSNMLEHVADRKSMCHALLSIVPKGGYIFVSCPYVLPFHADPIDTMFRPDIDELAAQFPGTSIVCSEIVKSRDHLTPGLIMQDIFMMASPFYRRKSLDQIRLHLSHLGLFFKRRSATCIILKKD